MRWLKIPVYVASALAVIVALGIVIPKLVFGVEPLVVQSGSMAPLIPTGSLVFAVPTAGENIEAGDVISYTLNARGTVVTHRVVAADRENRRFVVRGDGNQANDPATVPYGSLIGVVRLRVPLLGYAIGFVKTPQGMIVLGTTLLALILLLLLLGESRQAPQKRYSRNARYKPRY